MNIIGKTILAVALFGAGCGGAGLGVTGPAGQSPPPGADSGRASTGEVKVMKNGEVLTAYRTDAGRAALFEGELMIGLDSPDLRHTFVAYAGGAKAGAYPIGDGEGAGKAWLQFMSEALPTPAFAAQKGEVRITELSGALCSGTLTASRTEASGDLYTVEATFSQLPVRTRKQ